MNYDTLLTRDQFREAVFARDGHKCVFCSAPAVDAHHIMERRLFTDGGYYISNGASVCSAHHIQCETTEISLAAVREAAGITKWVIPSHLYRDQEYDKWGNPVLANGQRVKGELFHDESVQKILKQGGVLPLFTDKVKYPRTHHLPWSPGITDDDRVLTSLEPFYGQRVIVTTKQDGECTTIGRDYSHARSVDSGASVDRAYIRYLQGKIGHDIPEGWRICGENLYAQHSIAYTNLPSYFMGFSIWNEKNIRLGWDETLEWFDLFGITPVPILYDGIYDEKLIKSLWTPDKWDTMEGYVLTVADPISYGQFRTHVGKFVRPGHVQTAKHWRHGQPIIPNKLTDGVNPY